MILRREFITLLGGQGKTGVPIEGGMAACGAGAAARPRAAIASRQLVGFHRALQK
jgi:hypothetical protein